MRVPRVCNYIRAHRGASYQGNTIMLKFTRQDYLDGKCSHSEYYRQFATTAIKHRVKYSGIIEASQKEKQSVEKWDRCWGQLVPACVSKLMHQAGDYPTSAGMVCLAKLIALDEAEASGFKIHI